ncbi:glycine receptor subunit alpha-1-like isoform X3 [Acropora muricata]|uniref:glycine receptor subunit alpha-1-like isoform X3 n=1 Tax=Acropora muricata TaxID=159855 RepID=UPI0010FC89C4
MKQELRQRKRQMFGNPNVIIFILIVCLVFGYSQASGDQNKTSPTKTTLASATTNESQVGTNDAERLLAKILNQIQNKSDSRLRPKIGREPIQVSTDMFILDLGYISEANMEFRASFFLRMYWQDERLSYNNTGYTKRLALNAKMVQHMWIPDIYFVNEKSGIKHDLTKENEVVRLWPDGRVFHSMRISLTASCPMRLHNYPLDKQVCSMAFESFSYEDTELLFYWKKDKGNKEVMVSDELEIPQFILTKYWTASTFANFTSGAYSRLILKFQFERSIGFFLIQTYIPAYLIVMLSWISFWISHNSTPARIGLGITTVLTLTTLTNSARASLPKVSYVKSIEWFLILCFLYVFASLVEYAGVSFEINRRIKRGKEIPVQTESDDGGKDPEKKDLMQVMHGNVEANGHPKVRRRTKFPVYGKNAAETQLLQYRPYTEKEIEGMESKVDKWSRIGFPVSFMVFNIIYWVLTIQFS